MESRYALKRMGKFIPIGTPTLKLRRTCSRCGRLLAGSKGHGFPSLNGKYIDCGGCVVLKPPKGMSERRVEEILGRHGGT